MSDLAKNSGESSATPSSTQLPTPALSPISEHGDNTIDSSIGGGKTRDAAVAEAKASDERGSDLIVQSNGSVPTGRRKSSASEARSTKLTPTQLKELVTSPESLPVKAVEDDVPDINGTKPGMPVGLGLEGVVESDTGESTDTKTRTPREREVPVLASIKATPGAAHAGRPRQTSRSNSTPLIPRKPSVSKKAKPQLPPIRTDDGESLAPSSGVRPSPKQEPSPLPHIIPIPPMSLPTYLQLELASDRPSALYIHRSATSDFPYESSKIKFERLLNFLYLPPILEQVLWFGAIACLDAWLYTFTILPLRFLNALAILARWWLRNAIKEARELSAFVYEGIGRVWRRRNESSVASSGRPFNVAEEAKKTSAPPLDGTPDSGTKAPTTEATPPVEKKRKSSSGFRHRRTPSSPSAMQPNNKADLLQGLLIIFSCAILMCFDASRMYHSIRGQAAIKLYVIYNVLEVLDRLFSALGQDVLECLFSKETLERKENGRSKVIRPFWMFVLALVYNVVHSTALFYQVITLNVAVNSYSNALLTLLMSNQFVEIKGTVFKKFEKENLFQLTCADVVERFQLWLMLLIIALRNIVEVGGLTISLNSGLGGSPTESASANGTGIPLTSGFVIPKAFTLFPKWTGEVLGPFLIVLGSEALVDWCKHAYISKFNNVKPNIYGRFLDVLTKDYYSHAFADQNLTKRLGLPVIPLSCLFIRACMQTYRMFIATHMPPPLASSATGIALESDAATSSPATTAALEHIDHVFRRALGRSTFGAGADPNVSSFSWWSIDDVIALGTMVTFFLAVYFVLLAFKLLLGMGLLSFARSRYKSMKERERQVVDTQGKRVGGWGVVEVGEEKRRWIYEDDPDGLRELREKEDRGRKAGGRGEMRLDGVQRYSMAAKRIW